MSMINKHAIYKELQRELEEKKLLQDNILFSNEYVRVYYDLVNDWIYSDWLGYQTESSIKEGCEAILNFLVQYGCNKVLNDNTHLMGIWTPAAAWVGSNWLSRMQQAGLQYFAWIYSPSAMSRVSTDIAIDHTADQEVIRTFFSIDEAKDWLMRMQEY